MKRVLFGALALLCAVALASCGLVPAESPDTLYVDTEDKAKARMQQIADAVKHHDATALKAMYSPRALEEATDIDEGLDYFLSLFPNGFQWQSWNGTAAERQYKDGKLTEVLLEEFKVSADGHEYGFFIADFTVNEVIDPENVGLYALGVTPWPENHDSWIRSDLSGPTKPFYLWARAIHADEGDASGYPGVYVPGKR
jgi:hypothetical protein